MRHLPRRQKRYPSDYARNHQLVRQWRVLIRLEQRGWTMADLARELGVNVRTVRRDLYALEAAGFPLWVDDDSLWHLTSRNVTPARQAALEPQNERGAA